MTQVFVCVYENRHGTDIRVFSTFAKAQAWKDELGAEYWSEFSHDPQPEDPCGDEYFEMASENEEFFSIEELTLE